MAVHGLGYRGCEDRDGRDNGLQPVGIEMRVEHGPEGNDCGYRVHEHRLPELAGRPAGFHVTWIQDLRHFARRLSTKLCSEVRRASPWSGPIATTRHRDGVVKKRQGSGADARINRSSLMV